MALAVALDISPMHLLGLPEEAAPGTAVLLTPEVAVSDGELLMEWFSGQKALPQSDARQFYSTAIQRRPAGDSQQALADLTSSVLQDRAAAMTAAFNSEMAATLAKTNAAVQSGASPDEITALLDPGDSGSK
ncbi:hypothetical protein AB0O91_17275 [Kitasatospora sp. NPDC089797]|uniref:hypothetical protein n=1 Tax=Kitasatospora sp. NPDC089797 TaxID=3155298 RepID=UPI0034470DBD